MFLLIIWRYSYVLLENILWTSKLILGKSIYLHYVLFTSFIWQNNLKVTEENKSISELFENKNYAPNCHSHHLSNDELLFINKTTTSWHYSIPSPLLFDFIAFTIRSISSSLFDSISFATQFHLTSIRSPSPFQFNYYSNAFSYDALFSFQ